MLDINAGFSMVFLNRISGVFNHPNYNQWRGGSYWVSLPSLLQSSCVVPGIVFSSGTSEKGKAKPVIFWMNCNGVLFKSQSLLTLWKKKGTPWTYKVFSRQLCQDRDMQAYRKSKRNRQQPVSVPGGLKPDWYQNLAAGQEPFTGGIIRPTQPIVH